MSNSARRGIYWRLLNADLSQPLPIASDTYEGAGCSGTFIHNTYYVPSKRADGVLCTYAGV